MPAIFVDALVIVIGVAVVSVLGVILYAGGGPPDEERYCRQCRKPTPWHPAHGCTVCATR